MVRENFAERWESREPTIAFRFNGRRYKSTAAIESLIETSRSRRESESPNARIGRCAG